MQPSPTRSLQDVRLSGFSERAALAVAFAWLDQLSIVPAFEDVVIAEATGRVLAEPVGSRFDLPDIDRAATDGYAVRAADCDGASAYNPLSLTWIEQAAGRLPPGAASLVAAGWAVPDNADAVLSFDAAQHVGQTLDVLAPVAPGTGINRRGREIRAGATLLERGRRLRPQDLGWLAALGIASVPVIARPRAYLLVPGPKHGPDAVSPLLRALLERDGAVVRDVQADAGESGLASALDSLAAGDGAMVILAGRSGTGPDDVAAPAIRAAGGTLALHGLAMQPGGSAGLGMLGTQPVVLLPGEPFACMVAYDMLASRLVRRMGGLDAGLPYAVAILELERKIASGIGLAEIVPVRCCAGRARPVGIESGLTGPVRADGFVVVAETSEGYAAGTRVRVHLYDEPAV